MTVADVVRWLGISRDAVYDAIQTGDLPCRKLTRRQYLVTPQAVMAWLEPK
ncbi:helix-turn-helix domain-containing protein [Deinococcus cavernae]|nr:helix-turn-helix domain-containing protein [Deinococcus cavernae]